MKPTRKARTRAPRHVKPDRASNAAGAIIRALSAHGGRANMLELVQETVDERDDAPVTSLTRKDFEAGLRFLRRLGLLATGSKAA